MQKLLPLILALLLTACGGGGGGGSSPGNPSTPEPAPGPATGLNITFSTASLNFDYIEGTEPRAQTMSAQATGATDKDVIMGAEVFGQGIATPIHVAVNTVSRSASITVAPQRALAPGTYTGTIRMLACTSQTCIQHHTGSPHDVKYTVTVIAGLKPSVSTLALAAPQTGTASSRLQVTLAPNTTLKANVTYSGQAGWLTPQVNGNEVTLLASAATLTPGSYQAQLNLSAGSQQSIVPVTFTVSTGLSMAESGAIKIDSGTTAAQMRGTVSLALSPGAQARTWNASSNQPWLLLDKASGDFSGGPGWRIDTAAFAALANNSHHKATITVTTDSGLPSRSFVLDAHKALAAISGLDVYALLANQGGDVMVYGNSFDSLAAPQQAIKVGAYQPSAVTRLSNEVLRLTMPALPAGDYAVSVASASGMAAPAKTLKVLTSETYTYQALDTQGRKGVLIWDAGSKSAFLINRDLKSVMRYAPVGGQFQLIATRSFPFVDSIGMSADRSALILLSGATKAHKLAPADLSTISIVDGKPEAPAYTNELNTPLSIMGNNKLMYSYGWLDLDTGATTSLVSDRYMDGFGLATWGAVSRNGLRMIRPDSGLYSPRSSPVRFDLVGASFSTYGGIEIPFFYSYTVDRSGNNWAFNNQVVDFDWNLKGRIELPTGWYGNANVLSSDGSRLYYYAQNHDGTDKPRIYIFDTSRTLTTTLTFPVLGYIQLNDVPNCPYSTYNSDNCYPHSTAITITEDDRTLLLAGDTKFLVVPITATYRPAAGVRNASPVMRGQTVIPRVKR